MLVSTQTDHLASVFGDREAVRILAANGFDCIDYSMFGMNNPEFHLNKPGYQDYARELRHIADECGVIFNQSHAPFPTYSEGKDDYNVFILDAVKRSIEITSILGGDICVVHPLTIEGDEIKQRELNLERYHALESVCRDFGVKAALENMWSYDNVAKQITHAACSRPAQFNDYLDTLGDENFTACLDLGHCGLVGENAADMLRSMGSGRVKALHVHDNDGKHDSHTLPFTMKMDWKAIAAALRDIDYGGVLTFEADNFLALFPVELKAEASKFMLKTGRELVSMIENG